MTAQHTNAQTTATGAPVGDCCGPRALWGWSPPASPADTPGKRWVDGVVLRTGPPSRLYLALVIGLLGLAPWLTRRAELAVDGLAALAGSGWCGLNFWRCRHAHCLVTATGWLGLAAVSGVEAGLGRSVPGGNEQLVFVAVLVAGLVFEAAWSLAHQTNAVAPGRCVGRGAGHGVR